MSFSKTPKIARVRRTGAIWRLSKIPECMFIQISRETMLLLTLIIYIKVFETIKFELDELWESFRIAKCDHVCFEKRIFLNFSRPNLAQFWLVHSDYRFLHCCFGLTALKSTNHRRLIRLCMCNIMNEIIYVFCNLRKPYKFTIFWGSFQNSKFPPEEGRKLFITLNLSIRKFVFTANYLFCHYQQHVQYNALLLTKKELQINFIRFWIR